MTFWRGITDDVETCASQFLFMPEPKMSFSTSFHPELSQIWDDDQKEPLKKIYSIKISLTAGWEKIHIERLCSMKRGKLLLYRNFFLPSSSIGGDHLLGDRVEWSTWSMYVSISLQAKRWNIRGIISRLYPCRKNPQEERTFLVDIIIMHKSLSAAVCRSVLKIISSRSALLTASSRAINNANR